MSCKSLKGILVFFEAEHPYTRNTSRFYNPKIKKSFGHTSRLAQLAQGMQKFEQYDEICNFFAEGKQRHTNASEVQTHLQLHDLSVREYLTDKYDLL